jgi:cellulose synthase/poly-beta-1,6-N-acetylglucosamine synthase-like glycosyltransferase
MTLLGSLAIAGAAGLLMVWLVYPIAIGIAGRFRRRPAGAGSAEPTVSVVLATREPAPLILDRVRDCLATTWPAARLEIIIAHDGAVSIPDPASIFGAGTRVHAVVADEPGGKAAALNAGMRAATGDVVVFADTHQRYDPDTIPNLVAAVMSTGAGAATGHYELTAGSGVVVSSYWRFERWLRRAEARLHSSVGATGAVYAIRRNLWRPLPVGLILDDVYTPMSIVLSGHRVLVARDARAWEMRTPTATQEYGRKVRTLTGVMQLCAWLPGVLNPLRNPIWLQFVFHKLLRLLTPYFLLLIGMWSLATIVTLMAPVPLLVLAGLTAVLGAWIALSRGRRGARIRHLVVEVLLIQKAVLMAGINGLRGRWQVWDA